MPVLSATDPPSDRVSHTTVNTAISGGALPWPATFDWGLFCLRFWFGTSLFLKHGWEKPTHFTQMAAHFPDTLHLGPVPSLVIALLSDALCSLLVLFGLGTRWAALFILCNVFVAWGFVHHFQFFARGTPGELMGLYLAGFLALAIMGPGRFSLDHRLGLVQCR